MSEARRGAEPRIIVALDYADAEAAMALAESLSPGRCRLKVGKELFTRAGPDVVAHLVERGFEIFLDLKFHDIPNTVAGACRAAADLGVWMVDVHAAGGRRMLEAARDALHCGPEAPLLVAVTLLTSLDAADLRETGIDREPAEQVRRLGALAAQCGLDGVVCSPADLAVLGGVGPPSFLRVTPGVRPREAARGDQKRVMTPGEAIRSGADLLVIGRPITRAADPAAALAEIQAELESADPP